MPKIYPDLFVSLRDIAKKQIIAKLKPIVEAGIAYCIALL